MSSMILSTFTRMRCFLLAAIILSSLAACAGPAREPLESLGELNNGETIVVGRVELVPALKKDEQQIKGLNSGMFENKVFMVIDENYRVLDNEPQIADFAGRIEATLGKDFFVRSSNKSFYILAGMFYLEVGGTSMNRVFLPGNLKASIKPGDKAVYIGTIKYHRNEFFDITKITIADDYDRANAEFKKKFGTKLTLRKALLTSAK